MLEDDAFVGSVDFPECSDSNYFHRVDARDFSVTTVERKTHLVRSTIAIAFARESESTVGKRDADQNERRVRRSAGE